MILLATIAIWYMLLRWSIRHIHSTYDGFIFSRHFKNGDRVIWRGWYATVIDCKTVDCVIRRDYKGLLGIRAGTGARQIAVGIPSSARAPLILRSK
jgi:hypothetical protein